MQNLNQFKHERVNSKPLSIDIQSPSSIQQGQGSYNSQLYKRPVNATVQLFVNYLKIKPSNYRSPMNKTPGNKGPDKEYNPLKIPADWDVAIKHAHARSVGFAKEGDDIETCPCCGYEVERVPLDFFGPTSQLSFLGSGFPLFYNFIQYCIFILFTLFIAKGGYNLCTNMMGDFCDGKNLNAQGHTCPNNWIHKMSLANKIDRPDLMNFQPYLNLLVLVLITIILFFFRYSQRIIDKEIDKNFHTPADYTIIAKNIPLGLNVDYRNELTKIFSIYAVPESDQKIIVTKVVLVYDLEEIEIAEEALMMIVREKQRTLRQNDMNFEDSKIQELDQKIEEHEQEIEKIKKEAQETSRLFVGTAFISFLSQTMKERVLEQNQHTQYERVRAFFNKGKSKDLSSNDLSWMDQKLFLEKAPEPNDVDWEFFHLHTKHKIRWRIISWVIQIIFMSTCFLIIYSLSTWSDHLNDTMNEVQQQGDSWKAVKVGLISGAVSWIIVLFNKFVIGVTVHRIVDLEKISSKSKFNIQFAFKLTWALFLNTALISYVIDIVILGNIMSAGGFIQNETQVFLLNAFFPPLVWLIDPYNLLQMFMRERQFKNQKTSVVTQEEANTLMEHTEYYQAKRYADIMKTMWFTFLYGSAIPVGILLSLMGLVLYYWIDKYNVMRRRTIKENLTKEVSIEMIEMLEATIIFCGIGNMTMSYSFLNVIHWQDVIVFSVGLLFSFLPIQDINEKVFQIEGTYENLIILYNIDAPNMITYDQACKDFFTDYDRQNPITKKEALEEWIKLQKQTNNLYFASN